MAASSNVIMPVLNRNCDDVFTCFYFVQQQLILSFQCQGRIQTEPKPPHQGYPVNDTGGVALFYWPFAQRLIPLITDTLLSVKKLLQN